ncbi:MAG: DUF998 domain-containing protein, partial [Candidatus Methanoperedens sp.]|nr:DUF998 domain-containing protein [Candidatus Methanoperedens sp.]
MKKENSKEQKSIAAGQSQTAVSLTAARLSLAATAMFVVLLAALHIIKPEFDPSWHFISEYEIGKNGWIMQLAFFSLALGNIALFAAIRSQIRDIWGRIGLALLLVGAVGLVIAGIFITDPVTASHDSLTTSGNLHSLGGTLGIAGFFANLIIGWKLSRNKAWVSARWAILLSTGLVVIGFLVSAGSIGIMLSQNNGAFGPGV